MPRTLGAQYCPKCWGWSVGLADRTCHRSTFLAPLPSSQHPRGEGAVLLAQPLLQPGTVMDRLTTCERRGQACAHTHGVRQPTHQRNKYISFGNAGVESLCRSGWDTSAPPYVAQLKVLLVTDPYSFHIGESWGSLSSHPIPKSVAPYQRKEPGSFKKKYLLDGPKKAPWGVVGQGYCPSPAPSAPSPA